LIYSNIISVSELASHIGDPECAIVDCRFSLEDPGLGRKDYLDAHIPGSIYAHLDEDLCSPLIKGVTGRHPLPSVDAFCQKLNHWGIDGTVQVVAYDDAGGSMAAARLWWLLRWLGHYAVAVLDGGWQHWLNSGNDVRSGEETRARRSCVLRAKLGYLIEADEILSRLNDPNFLILDSRNEERYRGDVEPIDPVAGHIPGAYPSPHKNVLDENGKFLPPDALREHFQQLTGDIPARNTVFYCGSGVTAAQNMLAFEYAGLGTARLYAGSWSEWITDSQRPIATGSG
jgi:thiosulfate/3-mercaptopyruvate sulfurtransferase